MPSKIHSVQIYADCRAILQNPNVSSGNGVIRMYADPEILLHFSPDGHTNNGTDELAIKVNNEDVIRWSVFPKIEEDNGSDAPYSVIVNARYDWNSPEKRLLKNWVAWQGERSVPVYRQDALPMSQSANVDVVMKNTYMPYVSAQATLPATTPSGFQSEPEAYTFYILVYQGNKTPVAYRWDPTVTVCQP
jgi:hypothetical protein